MWPPDFCKLLRFIQDSLTVRTAGAALGRDSDPGSVRSSHLLRQLGTAEFVQHVPEYRRDRDNSRAWSLITHGAKRREHLLEKSERSRTGLKPNAEVRATVLDLCGPGDRGSGDRGIGDRGTRGSEDRGTRGSGDGGGGSGDPGIGGPGDQGSGGRVPSGSVDPVESY